jgi:hypothetical protein
VLVHDFVYVRRPAREIVESIVVPTNGWLADLAKATWTEEREVVTDVGPGDPLIKRPVAVAIGPARKSRDGTTAVPIHWQDESHPKLFPTLDGELVVTPLDEGRARLEIMARYEPPFGRTGRAIDDVLLHGLAESTIRSFLTRATAVLHEAATPIEGSEP